MALLISTNMYTAENVKEVLAYLRPFGYEVGVEVFPMFHEEDYEKFLQECLPELKKVPVSFHSPYYEAEHSASKGTPEYEHTMKLVQKTLKYCDALNSRYLVFHHNNCPVKNKEEMIRVSCENYREMEQLCQQHKMAVLVENAGVKSNGNMLLDQEKFIALCKKEQYQVLIDIGHANANGWDLRCVMEELRDQIRAYHQHNNDGVRDGHQRIYNGTLNFGKFLNDCRELTPGADFVMEYCVDVAEDVDGIKRDIRELLYEV